MEAVFEHVKGVTRRRLRLRRRRARGRELRRGQLANAPATPRRCRITYDPAQISYAPAAPDLFHGRPRPDPGQPPGPRHRPQLSLGDLPAERRQAGAGRAAFIARLNAGARLQGADRDARSSSGGFYPGRGLSPGFRAAAPVSIPISWSTTGRRSPRCKRKYPAFTRRKPAKRLRFHALFSPGATKAAPPPYMAAQTPLAPGT